MMRVSLMFASAFAGKSFWYAPSPLLLAMGTDDSDYDDRVRALRSFKVKMVDYANRDRELYEQSRGMDGAVYLGDPGCFSLMSRMSELSLSSAFSLIHDISIEVFRDEEESYVNKAIGVIGGGGTALDVMDITENRFIAAADGGGWDPDLITNFFHGGVLTVEFEGSSIMPMLERKADTFDVSGSMLSMLSIEFGLSIVREQLSRRGLDMDFKQVVDILAVQEFVNSEKDEVDYYVEYKERMAKVIVDVVNAVTKMNFAAVETDQQTLAIALYLLSDIVSSSIITVKKALEIVRSFVPLGGFRCGDVDVCEDVSIENALIHDVLGDERKAAFLAIVARLGDIEHLWRMYEELLGEGLALDFRVFLGGERGCEEGLIGQGRTWWKR